MSTIVYDFECPSHGLFEMFCDNAVDNDAQPCPECGASSDWRISAPRVRVPMATAAVHGGAMRADHPMAMDTRELGEGMPLNEWKKKRAKQWRDHDVNDPKKREFAGVVDKVANKADGFVRDRPDQKRGLLSRAMSWAKGQS